MTSYSISSPEQPWLVLFTGSTLDALAEAVAAQPSVDPSSIYASDDGKPRSLTNEELLHLWRCALELQPESSAISDALAAAESAPGAT
jgi:hypothetical protein